jgi:hypothetical protein
MATRTIEIQFGMVSVAASYTAPAITAAPISVNKTGSITVRILWLAKTAEAYGRAVTGFLSKRRKEKSPAPVRTGAGD